MTRTGATGTDHSLGSGGSGGELFKLRQVIPVVAGHGFEDDRESHGAALGMGDRLAGRIGRDVANEGQIPGAQNGEGGEGLLSRDVGVGSGPAVLIEGLEDVMIFSEGLAEAKGEGDFAVGEMAEDLSSGPFAGRRSAIDALRANGMYEGFERRGSCGEDLRNLGEGGSGVEEAGVGVEFRHGVRLSYSLCHCGNHLVRTA